VARRRIDALLAERGILPSREKARAALLAGTVRVNGEPVRKAGQLVEEAADITLTERPRFVSRGGEKLSGALAAFQVPVAGRRAIDVGASTGGFSDCLLQNGAESVLALDVGYGQLAWSLRTDERVTVVERTNVRDADPSALGAPFDIVVCDVSFISLERIISKLVSFLGTDGDLLALVKPQFEAGKGNVGKRGVVRDAAMHTEVLTLLVQLAEKNGLVVRGLTFSPITGPKGNIEFLLWCSRSGVATDVRPETVVTRAHEVLGG